jgi:hypothetical protein
MYRREKVVRSRGGGSISSLSDAAVYVEEVDSELRMRCERGDIWPDGAFSASLT